MRNSVIATIGSLMFLLGGCVSYQPKPLDPRAELAALDARTLPAGTLVQLRPAAAGPPDAPMFDASDGLSEAELMAVAVMLNPDLHAARASIGETEALLITAKTLPNPEVGLGFGVGLLGTEGFKLDTDLLFELLKPGEREARQAVAAARNAVSRAEVLAREYEVAAEVRRLVFTVVVAEQAAAVLDAELALRQQASGLVRRRKDVGEANDLDISAVDLELVEVQRDRRLAQIELEQARLALNRALGLPPGAVITLEASGKPLDVPLVDAVQTGDLDERLLANRLDLRAREAAYRVSEEELRLATARQFLRLKAGPNYEHEGKSENFAGVSASVEIPIFDRNQGEIAERTAARDRSRAEYAAALHNLRSEAAAALARVRALRAEIDTQQREVLPLLERSQTLSRGAFEARELNVLDWVTAQQRTLRSRRAYLDTVISYRRALLDLEALGGFPVWRFAPAPEPSTASSHERNTP
ncbi:MAG: TolC family protein [Phycisphaeraceae bacterium]|nr:TolC family protein [Phycisphaeraceae bacterium]